jgi:hypothetical protein
VNGVQVSSTSLVAAPNTTTSPIGIGETTRNGSDIFEGTLDEVAYYAGDLSPTRILAHYTASGIPSTAFAAVSLNWAAPPATHNIPQPPTGEALPAGIVWAGVLASHNLTPPSGEPMPAGIVWAGVTAQELSGAAVAGVLWSGVPATAFSTVVLAGWTDDLSQQALIGVEVPPGVLRSEVPAASVPAGLTERPILVTPT